MNIQEVEMVLAKWGNSLAVRIPVQLVEELNLKPGESVKISRSGEHGFIVERDRSREEAMEKLKMLTFELPADYAFNREELHER